VRTGISLAVLGFLVAPFCEETYRLAKRFVDAKILNDSSIARDTKRAADALVLIAERLK